jgi:hypothetical protein
MFTKIERMLGHAAYMDAYRPQIENSYQKALREGDREPVVLLFDSRDETAMEILQTSGNGDELARQAREGRRLGGFLVFTVGVERTLAVEILQDFFDEVAKFVAIPAGDSGSYTLVIIAQGSASAVFMPPIARAS